MTTDQSALRWPLHVLRRRIGLAMLLPALLGSVSCQSREPPDEMQEGPVAAAHADTAPPVAQPPDSESDPVDVGLTLRCEGPPPTLVVTLTLTNRSNRHIVVDRELVFGFDIGVSDERGSVVEGHGPERDVSIRNWTSDIWRQRIARLAPGETISRRIDLNRGVRQFSFARFAPQGAVGIRMGQSEALDTLAPDEFWDKQRGPKWLDVCCAFLDLTRYIEDYTGLRDLPRQLTPLRGFVAIDLRSGKQYDDYDLYRRMLDKDERLVSEQKDRKGARNR